MRPVWYILGASALLGYIFLAVFGLLMMPMMHQHSASMTDSCPFMLEKHSLCTMSVTEHLDAWQVLVQSTLAEILVIVSLVFIFYIRFLRPPNLARSHQHIQLFRERFFTHLFSQGILHSKAY